MNALGSGIDRFLAPLLQNTSNAITTANVVKPPTTPPAIAATGAFIVEDALLGISDDITAVCEENVLTETVDAVEDCCPLVAVPSGYCK